MTDLTPAEEMDLIALQQAIKRLFAAGWNRGDIEDVVDEAHADWLKSERES